MYLDAVNDLARPNTFPGAASAARESKVEIFDKWKDWPASTISHHGKLCCASAREWVTSTDFSALGGSSILTGPRWIRQRFKWGSSKFPIYWCQAVEKDTLDCGALAAIAYEVFESRGVTAYRIQMVQRFSELSTFQWAHSWENGQQLPWTKADLIYHEGCAIATDGELKVWDASAGWWIDSRARDGYGSLLALRLSAPELRPDVSFKWGEHNIAPFEWLTLS
jgi:hypothetical protein